jgi:hypothetical protein
MQQVTNEGTLTNAQARVEHERNVTSPSDRTSDVKVARVQAFSHGLSLVLRHHAAPYEVVESLVEQLNEFLMVSEESVFLKRAKYVILWPMAVYLDQEDLPPMPDLSFRFRGRFWRWARQRLNHYSRKNSHLWYSFLQGKRAALPVTPEIVLENFLKHRNQMELPDPLREGFSDSDLILDEVLENLDPVLRTLRKILDKELGSFFDRPEREIHQGSGSASIESSRKAGGQAGQIRKLLGVTGLREMEQTFRISATETYTQVGSHDVYSPLEESRARYGELQDLEEVLVGEIRSFGVPRTLDAKVEAVLEPFKVRTISKGESLPYYLAKRMQLVLHGAMRKMECFRLIGRPLDATDLMDLVKQSNFYLDSEESSWLSIDYSAATDGLSARLSSEIMKQLLGNLFVRNPYVYNMMLSVLAPHRIFYPKVAGVQLDPVLQQNGQLMGSVLSFPILCLANLGLYLTVRKRERPWAPLRNLLGSVLVNGDDMLYIGSKSEWDLHKVLGKRIGLEMSPGKAYLHKRYANVNSTSLDMDLSKARSSPVEVKFLNVGLMVGQHKVLGKVGSDDDIRSNPVSAVIAEVVRGSLPRKQADVFKQYCSMHSGELKREIKGRNLFVPKVLGGMGVEPILGIETTLTLGQVALAERLMKIDRLVPIERPLNQGWEIQRLMEVSKDPIHLAVEREETELKMGYLVGPISKEKILYPWWGRFKPL